MNDDTGRPRSAGRSRLWRVGALAVAAAGAVLLAAACGGSGPASPAGSSSPHPAGYRQYHAYSQCMRSHGAPFWPEPV